MKLKKTLIFFAILFLPTFIMTGCWVDTGIAKSFVGIDYSTYDIDHEEIFELGKIRKIDIEANSDNINFYKSDSDDIKVHLYGKIQTNYKPELIVTKKTNSVIIETKKSDVKSISIKKGELNLDVYLPKNYDKELNISNISGDINIDNYSLYKLIVSSVSGSVRIKNINAEEVNVNTTSGNLDLNNINCGEYFESYSVSGKCEIDKLQSKEVECYSTSGRVSINNLNTNELDITSVSGEIKAHGSIKSIDINTTSGDVDIKTDEIAGDIDIETVSGTLKLKLPEDCDVNFVSETISGTLDAQYKFSNIKINRNKSRGTKGTGKYDVDVSTVSGDITIY